MNKNIDKRVFYTIISLVAIFAVACVGNAYSMSQNVNVEGNYNYYEAIGQPEEINLGGSGTEHYSMMNFYDGMMIGNASSTLTATTSANTLLLTARQLCENKWFLISGAIDVPSDDAGTTAGFNLSFPTAAALNADCFRGQGMQKLGGFWFQNESSYYATTTAGTGGELLEGDSLTVDIDPDNWVYTEIIMNSAGDRYILLSTEYQDG